MSSYGLDTLLHYLTRLPGVGSRSARRMALFLLRNRERVMLPLAEAMAQAAAELKTCTQCGNIDRVSPCTLCTDNGRDNAQICVVEDLADLWALERGGFYRGRYHVLGGTLSAIEGRGPDALRIPYLVQRACTSEVEEVILATNATVEGQTTAHYLTEQLSEAKVRITRLAQGIPMGGELDYLDEGTLGAALRARMPA